MLGVLGEQMSPEGGLLSVFAATGAGGALAWVLIRNQLRKNDERDNRLGKVEDERAALVREVITATNACTQAVREIAASVDRSTQRQEETCFHVRSLVEALKENGCTTRQNPKDRP